MSEFKTPKGVKTGDMVMHLTAPVFPGLTEPFGNLPDQIGAQACWYYYLLAHKAMVAADESDQIVYDDEPWRYRYFIQIKRSVSVIYGLAAPDEMDKFWDCVKREAARQSLPPPSTSYMYASPIRRPAGDETSFKLN